MSTSTCRASEPVVGLPNLDLVKQKLVDYHDCKGGVGCYENDLEKVGDRALDFLKQYREAHPNDKKLAVVIDIDETAPSSWDNMKEMVLTRTANSRTLFSGTGGML